MNKLFNQQLYTPFELLPQQKKEKEKLMMAKGESISRSRDSKVKAMNLHKLNSDYLNCSNYYLDFSNRTIWEHENQSGIWTSFSSTDPISIHLRELNHLN